MDPLNHPSYPLPAILFQPFARGIIAQRHGIVGFDLEPASMHRFNQLLHWLDPQTLPVSIDQMASAIRIIASHPLATPAPPCILQRMRRAAAIELMLDDQAWQIEPHLAGIAQRVVAYLKDKNDLIADALPRIGRLDDAMIVEIAWRCLANEVRQYLDYCRVRQTEAALRGLPAVGLAFSRGDWHATRQARHAMSARRARALGRSYAPMDV